MHSIIICTYNREKYIYNALKSIAEQDYPRDSYEIVVINNNSSDKTEDICLDFQKDYPHIKFQYHIETQQGLSFARNKGIEESKGDILIYLDDDAEAVPGYLQEYDAFFRQYPEAIAAGGKIIPCFEGEEPRWMSKITRALLGGEINLGEKTKPFKSGKYPGGGNSAYRSWAFEKFGAFNTSLGRSGASLVGSEEKDMYDRFRKEGFLFYYLPKAAILHHVSASRFSKEHFKKLSYAIGVGERIRTRSVSKKKYLFRLFQEIIKWAATIVLFAGYTAILQPQKGWKLIQFRWNLSKGLLASSLN